MFVVDTNVLVYVVNDQAPEQARCRDLLERWRVHPEPWFLTWGIIYEFLRVATHRSLFSSPLSASQAWLFLEALLESPSCQVLVPTARHPLVLAAVIAETPGLAGNQVHDAHIAMLMREHGIRTIVTRGRDFRRFPFVETLDPLTATPAG